MRISEWSSDVCSSDLSRLLQKFPRYRSLKKESQHMSKIYLWALLGLSCLLTACSGDMNCEDDEVIDTIRQIIAEHTSNGAADAIIAAEINDVFAFKRSEERRVGKECVSTCRSRWSRTP